jgi:long-chain fatty acid transport protein
MIRSRSFLAALAGVAGLTASTTGAGAAGFAIKEQSAQALGSAFAGSTAEAADVSYMFFNPAALSQFEGSQAQTVLSFIAPASEPKNVSGQTDAAFGNAPITGGSGGSDIGEDALVPALYGMTSINEEVKLGVGVNVPFGLETDYNEGWVGRYHALNSELATVNINPAVSYEPTPGVAFAAGAQIQYVTAELTNAVDFGSIGAANGIPFANPTQNDGKAELEGDDWGFGFNLGVLLEPREGTRIGASYRSEINHELEGDLQFSGGGAVLTALQGSGAFTNRDITADLTTPDNVNFGVYHEVTDRLAVMGEVQYTFWSDFKELLINADAQTPPQQILTEEEWENVWFGALGAKYQARDDLTLRTGVAFDQSPIPDETRTPRITGEDRYWIALGANYAPMPWLSFNASYTHIFVADSTIDLASSDPGNTFRGDLQAEFDNHVDIATVSATVRF